ncbi:MAG TPA: serine/threonine-protein kinase [Polyangiaceae bacterium]|jgi:serine/threonine-protein kinase|nr:serine/threonine-protein kinase [Polyangiaceae bacterium]
MPSPPSEALRRLEAGIRVGGKYRLARRIAVGGMGEVWRARNETTGADVAVKVSRRSDVDGVDVRFRTEAKLGSMVSHRNIVRIFDLVEDADGSLVLVMELLRGESLAEYLKARGRLDTREALAIALPILSGLGHAHAEGIVHRDVTPANVFLAVDPDGQVTPKLIDFGIAKLPAVGNHTLDGRVLGTPRYMAPEQIRGQTIDGRADLFSLAVVLYEAIAGSCPFDATTPAASLAAVLEVEVDPDPQIEPRVWLELARALGKRPYTRHPSASAFAEGLRLAAGETDTSLAPLLRRAPPSRAGDDADAGEGPPHRSTIEGQSVEGQLVLRRPAWIAWAIGATAAVLAGGLALVLLPSPHRPRADDATPVSPAAAPGPAALPAAPTTELPRPPASAAELPSAATSVAPAPAPAPPRSPVRPAPHPVRPRPIGTTPGF